MDFLTVYYGRNSEAHKRALGTSTLSSSARIS